MTLRERSIIVVIGLGLLGVVLGPSVPWRELFAPGVETRQRHAGGEDGIYGAAMAQASLPPVANAGRDRSNAGFNEVQLDGSGSTHPSGESLSYSWRIVSKPEWVFAEIDEPNSVRTSLYAEPFGEPPPDSGPNDFVIELTVTDSSDLSDTDTVIVSLDNVAALADPGADRRVQAGDTVVLDASRSSDDEGNLLSYSWTLASVPVGSTAVLDDPSALRPSFIADLDGTYVAELVVNDGQADSAVEQIVVTTEGVAPVAEAGPDVEVDVDMTVRLDASRSTDADGDALDYAWALLAAPDLSTAQLDDPTAVRPSLTIDQSGLYVLQLTVTDVTGMVDRDTVVLATDAVSPVANAGPDQSVALGATVALDGAASTIRDNEEIGYQWALITRPTGSLAEITTNGSNRPDTENLRVDFVADVAGTYVAQLVAVAGFSDPSLPDTVVITTDNSRPAANAGPDQTVALGATVQLDGGASSDADGDALSYRWAVLASPAGVGDGGGGGGGTLPLDEALAADPTLAPISVDYTGTDGGKKGTGLRLTSMGKLTAADTTLYNVWRLRNSSTEQRSVVLNEVSTGSNQNLDLPARSETFALSLATGGADTHRLYLDGTQIDVKAAGPQPFDSDIPVDTGGGDGGTELSDPTAAAPTFVAAAEGLYIFQLIVKDGLTESPADTIVVSTVNSRPLADAGADQELALPDVQLDGSGSTDADGDALAYVWRLISLPRFSGARLSDPTAQSPTFATDLPGFYVVQLIVNDGRFDSDPVTVVISALNGRPEARISGTSVVLPGSLVSLSGRFSSDPDDDPITYAWTLLSRPEGSTAVLSGTDTQDVSFLADVAGPYEVQLVVNDGIADSLPRLRTAYANNRPTADAGPDQDGFIGEVVQLDGTASSDPDGDPLTFSWFLSRPSGSQAVLSDRASPTPTFVPDIPGSYRASLTVRDRVEGSPSAQTFVTVVNRLPVAEAEPSQSLPVNSTVQLDGGGSRDADGQPITFRWALDTPLGSTAAISDPTSVNPTFVPDIAGQYSAVLVVNDGIDDSPRDAALITATPLGDVNVPPVLQSIGNQSVAVGSSLGFTLAASDDNLDQLRYFASPAPLPTGMSLNSATGVFMFAPVPAQAGTLTLTFGVSDGLATATETVVITVIGGDPGGETVLTGLVLDANDGTTAVSGATVSLLDTGLSATTDAEGRFTLGPVQAERLVLNVDGTNAGPAPNGAPYASLRNDIDLIAGVTNEIEPDVFLPRVDPASSTIIDPTRTTTVENAALGASLTVFSDGAFNPDGTPFTGAMTISGVPVEQATALLPPFISPCNLVSIEPSGITFDSLFGGATITLPNLDNLPSGTPVDIWALDPTTGTFFIVDEGVISSGNYRGSIPFSTLVFAVPRAPSAAVSADHNGDNHTPTALADGNLFESFSLPGYRTLGQDRTRTLVYNSTAAVPIPILAAEVTLPAATTLPPSIEGRLEVGGIEVATSVFTGTDVPDDPDDPGLAPGDTIRQAISFDASRFPSGSHPYRFVSTANYGCSRVGSVSRERVLVSNQEESPFGAGWTLAELQRVIKQDDGRAVVLEGDGTTLSFPTTISGDNFFDPLGFAVVAEPLTAAVDDLNGDGALDIAVADQAPGAVKIFLGDGSGGFTEAAAVPSGAPTTEGTPPDTFAVDTGDFNGDGIRDLAVANQASGNLKVFLGNGDGTFLAGAVLDDFVSGRRPTVLAVGDLDRDGNDDIATSEVFSGFGLFIGDLKVYYGDGTGGFTSQVFDGRRGAVSVAIDDLNGDGLPDVALASDVDSEVSVYLNTGARGFTRREFYAGPIGVLIGRTALASGDIDGDGDADLVVANQANTLSLLRNKGRGTFRPREELATGGPGAAFEPKSVAIADLDNDGRLDIVASGEAVGNATVLLGDDLGGFLEPSVIPVGSPSGNSLAVADFDANGLADLVVGSTSDNLLYLLRADPNALAPYQAPPADFSTLVENDDGSFTRRLKDGTRFEFDTAGLMTAEVDRNGNQTRYFYDADGRVTKIAGPTSPAPEEPPCPTEAVPSQDVTCMAYTGGKLSSIVDPTGRTTTIQVDSLGDLAGFTHPDSNGRQFGYDANHRLDNVISKRGFPTTHSYGFAGQWLGSGFPDAASISTQISKSLGLPDLGLGGKNNPAPYVRPEDRIATFTDGKGNITTVEVNEFGSPLKVTDPIGRTTLIERNADDLVTQVTRPNDGELPDGTVPATVVTQLDYDERGNLTLQREAAGTALERETRFEYEPTFSQTTKIIDPSNTDPDPQCGTEGVTCFAHDPTNGNLLETTDAAGTRFTQAYDDLNCPGIQTRTTAAANRPGEERTTDFVYDPATCNLDRIIDAERNVTKFDLDATGNVRVQTEGFDTPEARTTSFTYDALNRVETETDGADGTTTALYDAAGNPIEFVNPVGLVITGVYDERDLLTENRDPVQGPISATFDANQNLKTIMTVLGSTTSLQYDSVDRVIMTTDPSLRDRFFARNAQDYVKTVTDARTNSTEFAYDVLGRTVRRTNPLGETWTFEYDSRDNLTKTTDAKGQVIQRSYDELSRLKQLVAKRVDGTVEDALTFTYDAQGNRLTAVDGDSSLAFTYDAVDRVETVKTLPGGVQPQVTLTNVYNAVGNRRQLLDSAGGTTLMEYDGAGRLARLTSPASNNIDLVYDAAGRLERIDFPNTVVSDVLYDLDERIEEIRHRSGENQFTSFAYTYDDEGKVISITEPAGTRNFTYDATRQLRSGGFAAVPESYTYDGEGNRLTSHLSTVHDHDAANRLNEDDAHCYSYDANGNLETKTEKVGGLCTGGVTNYIWDVQNRLVRIDFPDTSYAAYRYDAVGRRIEKDVNGSITRYVYDEDDILLEYDDANALVARYSHGNKIDQPLVLERDGGSYFYQIDHLGSVRKLTNAVGTVVNSYDMDSFGGFESRIEGVSNPFTFTAREFDSESGLYYFRARYYDPTAGRFISEDPIGFNSKDLNLYRYVFNDPLTFTDPQGTQLITTARLNCAGAALVSVLIGHIYLMFAEVPPYDEAFVVWAKIVAEFGIRGLITGCGFVAVFKGRAALETTATLAGGFLGGVLGVVQRYLVFPDPAF